MKFLSSSSSSASFTTTTSTTSFRDNASNSKIRDILESHGWDVPSAENHCQINLHHIDTLTILPAWTPHQQDSTKVSKITTTGWFSRVFRGLLCRNRLPTYPSDRFKLQHELDFPSTEHVKEEQWRQTENKIKRCTTPGVIAKLMGLESFPPIPLPDIEKSPTRSLSMNSMDALKKLGSIQESPRRVKSFREIPTFLLLEDEKFFIFSFEHRHEEIKSEMGSVERKRRLGGKGRSRSKSKRKQGVSDKNKENQNANFVVLDENLLEKVNASQKGSSKVACCDGKHITSSIIRRPNNHFCVKSHGVLELKKLEKGEDDFQKHECGKQRRRNANISQVGCLQEYRRVADCESKKSSPNSVLDHSILLPYHPNVFSSGEISMPLNSRKLNPRHTKGLINSSSYSKAGGNESKVGQLRKKCCENSRCLKLCCHIQEMVENEIIASIRTQGGIQKLQDIKEEISREVGVEILDRLLGELVDQLVSN